MSCAGCGRVPCACVTVRSLETGEVLRVEVSPRAHEISKFSSPRRKIRKAPDGLLSVSEYSRLTGIPRYKLDRDPASFGAVKGWRKQWRYPHPPKGVPKYRKRKTRAKAGLPHACPTDRHPDPHPGCYRHGCRCTGCTTAHSQRQRGYEAASRARAAARKSAGAAVPGTQEKGQAA